jgi:effector-binding domain-containing protein
LTSLIRSRIRFFTVRHALLGLSFAVLLALAPQPLPAQETGVPRPAPVETAPLSPPGGAAQSVPTSPPATGSGGITLTQEPPAPSGAPAAPAPPVARARPTLVPTPGDPLDVKEVTLPAKPAAVLSGQSTWDEGFDNLKNAFAKIESELGRAGLRPAGRPIAVFVGTDDAGFRYDAMVPIEKVPEGREALTPEIRFGRTPEGKAYLFVHKGPYDDIDSTYETITAYLDAKGIIAKDVFIEEYVTDLTDSADDNLEINIFVQPR